VLDESIAVPEKDPSGRVAMDARSHQGAPGNVAKLLAAQFPTKSLIEYAEGVFGTVLTWSDSVLSPLLFTAVTTK
jgi:hypothetical protein